MRIPGFDAEASVYRTSNAYRGAYGILADNVAANEHNGLIGTPWPAAMFSGIQPARIFAQNLADGLVMDGIATSLARSTASAALSVHCDRLCTIAYAFCPAQRQNCINICNRQCAPRGLLPCFLGPGPCPVTRCRCGEKCCGLGDVCCGGSVADGAPGKCCPEDRCCRSLNVPDGECCSLDVRCTLWDGCCRAGRIPCGRAGDIFRECCPWGKICRNGQCVCPSGQVPCGEGCCAPGEFCQDGVCTPSPCPPGRAPCGTACCNPGWYCCHAPLGRCCPEGTVCCVYPSGSAACCTEGSTCCSTEFYDFCCGAGTTCCNIYVADCCDPGEVCTEMGCQPH